MRQTPIFKTNGDGLATHVEAHWPDGSFITLYFDHGELLARAHSAKLGRLLVKPEAGNVIKMSIEERA